ncbi:DUF6522 family protein [Roseovarius sp. D22-M7]|uniref:DUF6522 family protein n=1 Tax=Roseovarius sp. D22-M7 TaxID=3127116 RepID=UPI00301008D3
MSEASPKRRIRAQASARDTAVMGFVLDDALVPGRSARFDAPGEAALPRALFDLTGVTRVEVSGATIWVRKDATADWAALKPAIAAAIRQVLDTTDAPLGPQEAEDNPDTALLQQVEALLNTQVNPAVAAHGGHIAVEKVEAGTVHLRMSGGCQGCAASAATLRDGVERMLRAALPQIRDIEDVTDHGAGDAPYYTREDGPSPMLNRPVPPGVIDWQDGQLMVDPDYLAPRLGLTPETLHEGLQSGDVVGVTETGQGEDEGKTRIVLRSATRAWAAEVRADGSAREIPPPRSSEVAADKEQDLATRVRTHLEALDPEKTPITYGALARALGLWLPGSVRRVTRALEITMREDAAADRPFIAARAVSRGGDGLPGPGFFDLAQHLSRGPDPDESKRDFHARELSRLTRMPA